MIFIFTLGSKDLNELNETVMLTRLRYICEHNSRINFGYLYNFFGQVRKFKYANFSIDLLEINTEEIFLNRELTIYSFSLEPTKILYAKYRENIREVIFFGVPDFLYPYYLGKYGVAIRKLCKFLPGCRQFITGPMFNGRSNIDVLLLLYVLGLTPYIKYFLNKPVKKSILLASPFALRSNLLFLPINTIDFDIIKKIHRYSYPISNDKKGSVVILGPSPTHLDNKQDKSNFTLSVAMADRLKVFLNENVHGKVDIWGHPRDVFFTSTIASNKDCNVVNDADRQWKYETYIVFYTTLLYSIPDDSQVELLAYKEGGIRDSAFIKYAKVNDITISTI
jgi:hypothetical protein